MRGGRRGDTGQPRSAQYDTVGRTHFTVAIAVGGETNRTAEETTTAPVLLFLLLPPSLLHDTTAQYTHSTSSDPSTTTSTAAVPPMQDEEIDIDGEGINGEDEEAAAARDALEIIAMKARVAEMEQEAAKLREMNAAVAQESEENAPVGISDEEKEAVDSRSIYVGNVSMLPPGEEMRGRRGRMAAHTSLRVQTGGLRVNT